MLFPPGSPDSSCYCLAFPTRPETPCTAGLPCGLCLRRMLGPRHPTSTARARPAFHSPALLLRAAVSGQAAHSPARGSDFVHARWERLTCPPLLAGTATRLRSLAPTGSLRLPPTAVRRPPLDGPRRRGVLATAPEPVAERQGRRAGLFRRRGGLRRFLGENLRCSASHRSHPGLRRIRVVMMPPGTPLRSPRNRRSRRQRHLLLLLLLLLLRKKWRRWRESLLQHPRLQGLPLRRTAMAAGAGSQRRRHPWPR